jgi:hypothetical protein
MDKIDFYKKSVRRLAEEVANLGQLPDDNIKTQLVTDDEHGHYLLYFTLMSCPTARSGCNTTGPTSYSQKCCWKKGFRKKTSYSDSMRRPNALTRGLHWHN